MSGVNWVEEGFGRQNVCRVNGEEFQGRRAEELGCVGCCWLWERMGESSVSVGCSGDWEKYRGSCQGNQVGN